MKNVIGGSMVSNEITMGVWVKNSQREGRYGIKIVLAEKSVIWFRYLHVKVASVPWVSTT